MKRKLSPARRNAWIRFYLAALAAVLLVCFALFSSVLAPYDPLKTFYDHMLEGPSRQFLFGTDQLGRDLFSRILWGGKSSLLIAFAVTGIVATVGILIGTAAGYAGGVFDNVLMRFSDMLMAFPGSIFTIALVSFIGTGIPNLILAMSLPSWTGFARISRSHRHHLNETRIYAVSEGEFSKRCDLILVEAFHYEAVYLGLYAGPCGQFDGPQSLFERTSARYVCKSFGIERIEAYVYSVDARCFQFFDVVFESLSVSGDCDLFYSRKAPDVPDQPGAAESGKGFSSRDLYAADAKIRGHPAYAHYLLICEDAAHRHLLAAFRRHAVPAAQIAPVGD